MSRTGHDQHAWHKSSYSAAEGSCVEVAEGATVLVRDTKNLSQGHIEYSRDSWSAFLRDLKNDRF